MNFKNYTDLSKDILEGVKGIPSNIDLVVGIPRSGMVPAYMIGAQLNLPVTSLDTYLLGHNGSVGERKLKGPTDDFTHVLIVDDSVYSGEAITKAKIKLEEKRSAINHFFCAVYSATEDNDFVDFYFKYLPTPRVFQWNYKNHFITTQSCYDIDGVLCVDPTDEENDDGVNYRRFLLEAKPLFIPSYKIPCLVTSRLEKYRGETEAWLLKHNVDYDELIMLDLPSAKERRAKRIHGEFKANIFKEREELYFIESNWRQAKTIFELTSKPVFCAENDVLIQSKADIFYYESVLSYQNNSFFVNYYNRINTSNFTNFKSLVYLITPPIIIKLFLKLFKK